MFNYTTKPRHSLKPAVLAQHVRNKEVGGECWWKPELHSQKTKRSIFSNKETLSTSKPSNERHFSHPNPSGYKEFS